MDPDGKDEETKELKKKSTRENMLQTKFNELCVQIPNDAGQIVDIMMELMSKVKLSKADSVVMFKEVIIPNSPEIGEPLDKIIEYIENKYETFQPKGSVVLSDKIEVKVEEADVPNENNKKKAIIRRKTEKKPEVDPAEFGIEEAPAVEKHDGTLPTDGKMKTEKTPAQAALEHEVIEEAAEEKKIREAVAETPEEAAEETLEATIETGDIESVEIEETPEEDIALINPPKDKKLTVKNLKITTDESQDNY
jgi:hypothetical protein